MVKPWQFLAGASLFLLLYQRVVPDGLLLSIVIAVLSITTV
jgi:hypothetical protein